MAGPENISFCDLAGWATHDHKAAFAAFFHAAGYLLKNPPEHAALKALRLKTCSQSRAWLLPWRNPLNRRLRGCSLKVISSPAVFPGQDC